ncbi:MAG TPA: hypothetical protein VEJ20_03825 [Candidatus Eremiobacteraceae bacterium]|nr:hypothetical protein [Candidatus Eremiobacteraceae bacterium]
MMQRKSFILGASAALAAVSAQRSLGAPVPLFVDLLNGRLGADLSGTDFKGVLSPLLPDVWLGTSLEVLNPAPPTATRVVLKNLPAVSTQGVPGNVGDPGSCEAQSFGYCLGSYTAARMPNGTIKWDAGDARNEPSAGWLYRWQVVKTTPNDGPCPNGSLAVPYVQRLISTGAPSTAAFPYNPHDLTTPSAVCTYIDGFNVSTVGPDAKRFLLGSYKAFSDVQGGKNRFLDTFKSLIRHGHAIAFSGLVPYVYCVESPPLVKGAFTAPKGFIQKSGHGQVIVGFDDSIGPDGAFLVQNSFGPGWNPGPYDHIGRNGRIWYGYDAWFEGQEFALIAFSNQTGPPTGVRLTGSLNGSPTGMPALYVRESRRYQQGGNAYLALVLHAEDALEILQVQVTGPKGFTSTQKLDELLRFGYAYVERKPPYAPGRYAVQITAKLHDGAGVIYQGHIDVT